MGMSKGTELNWLNRFLKRAARSRKLPFVHINELANHWRGIRKDRKVLLEKQARAASGFRYCDNPRVTFVLQFFNKRERIVRIAKRLLPVAEELIVIDDGSIDGSFKEWMKILDGPNHFLLRCNDLYEVRTYDRAMRMARGEFVCFLQDDDILPMDGGWVKKAVMLFERFPRLAVLGGRGGAEVVIPDNVVEGVQPVFTMADGIGTFPGVCKQRIYEKPVLVDPVTGIAFMFAMEVNRAPWFVRRKEMLGLGGLNQEYAPFQCDDVDACIRAWLGGYKVGLFEAGFAGDVRDGGMRRFNGGLVAEQSVVNWGKVYRDYGGTIQDGVLQAKVDDANSVLMESTT